MPASSFWADLKGQSGADEVDKILGERLFAFPKSIEFIRRVLQIGAGPHDCILDCTAGSGTTAHAVLALNKEEEYQLLSALHPEREGRPRTRYEFPEELERPEQDQGDLLREGLGAPGRFGEIRR